MPTIHNPFQVVTTEPTSAERLAAEIRKASASVTPFLVSAHQHIYTLLWQASLSQDATPQAVLDALGTDAAKLFIDGYKLVQFLQDNNYATFTQEEWAAKQAPTLNPDGTVTLAP